MTTPTQPHLQPSPEQEKGAKGSICNRGECSNPNARWFNKSTRKYYCQPCAFLIMRWPENEGLLVLEEPPEQEKRIAEIANKYFAKGCNHIGNVRSDFVGALTELAADFAKERAELEHKCNMLAEGVQSETNAHMEALRAGHLISEDLSTLRSANAELERRLSERERLPEEYEKELDRCEAFIKEYKEGGDMYGVNFHEGRMSGIITGNIIEQQAKESLRTQLADTQAKLEEANKKLAILPGLTESLNEITKERLALAAALKQTREAANQVLNLTANATEAVINQHFSEATEFLEDALMILRKPLAAPADLGMVEGLREVLSKSAFDFSHGGAVDAIQWAQNKNKLLTDLGGQPNQ